MDEAVINRIKQLENEKTVINKKIEELKKRAKNLETYGDQLIKEKFKAITHAKKAESENTTLKKIRNTALDELAKTWNAVGMLGKRNWTTEHILSRLEAIELGKG